MHCLNCFRWCVILNLLRGFVINKRFNENTLMLNFIDYISLLCNKEGTEEITIAKICITPKFKYSHKNIERHHNVFIEDLLL